MAEPFVEGWVSHVSAIDQRDHAIAILTSYLTKADDWIVLN